eukprot:PhF_6_TR3320/c0_g1_i1/m.4684
MGCAVSSHPTDDAPVFKNGNVGPNSSPGTDTSNSSNPTDSSSSGNNDGASTSRKRGKRHSMCIALTFKSATVDSIHSSTTLSPLTKPSQDWKVREDTDNGWRLLYPSRWTYQVLQTLGGTHDTMFKSPDKFSGSKCHVIVRDVKGVETTPQALDAAKSLLMSTIPNSEQTGEEPVLLVEEVEVCGTRALHYIHQQDTGDSLFLRVEGYRFLGPRPNTILEIDFVVSDLSYPKYGPVFTMMLSSLRIQQHSANTSNTSTPA